jgi:hypothetical protein
MTTSTIRLAAFAGSLAATMAVSPTTPAFAQGGGSAAVLQRFVGTWEEDVAQRKIGAMAHLRFQRDSKGALQEVRGSDARPAYQNVVFDGTPHPLPGSSDTITWKQHSASSFERVYTDKGGVLNTRRMQVSADGKTLTDKVVRRLADGRSAEDTILYQRTTGDAQGLVGRWKPQSFKTSIPGGFKYEAAGKNGLKWANLTGVTWAGALDGKAMPVVGPGTLPGSTRSAKSVDDYTIEFTNSREGVATGKTTSAVSRDGKTMTVTVMTLGPNASTEPSVNVYVRQ